MGRRSLYIYRDDERGVTRLEATNSDGFGERPGSIYYYSDRPDDIPAPGGPYHTEMALVAALKAREEEAGQEMMPL
jgi:hypothetical protein